MLESSSSLKFGDKSHKEVKKESPSLFSTHSADFKSRNSLNLSKKNDSKKIKRALVISDDENTNNKVVQPEYTKTEVMMSQPSSAPSTTIKREAFDFIERSDVISSSHMRQSLPDNDVIKPKPPKRQKRERPKKNLKHVTAMTSQPREGSKQCLGRACVRAARSNSKYCSDTCGRRLARDRLTKILPSRISDWHNTITVADEIGREDLERTRLRMEVEKVELKRLEEKFQRLEEIIWAAKRVPKLEEQRSDDDEWDVEDLTLRCVICGQSITFKSAIKHMDRCFNKIEAMTSFGSVYPTKIEGSKRLFCDEFNEQQQTYCKRLQVLCPEHTKEMKISDDEICGCPLDCQKIYSKDFDLNDPNNFCRISRKKCNRHFKWETLFRSEVDLQRIRQWLKIDEIFDDDRRIRSAMSNRAGVLSLLLHQRIRHDETCTDMRTKPTISKKPAYRLMI